MDGEWCEWLDIDSMYQALGYSEVIRQTRYKRFIEEAIPPGERELIRESVNHRQNSFLKYLKLRNEINCNYQTKSRILLLGFGAVGGLQCGGGGVFGKVLRTRPQ